MKKTTLGLMVAGLLVAIPFGTMAHATEAKAVASKVSTKSASKAASQKKAIVKKAHSKKKQSKKTVAKTYSDPVTYCAAVGNQDTLDKRYTGSKLPASIVKSLGLSVTEKQITQSTPSYVQWRCMDKKVWTCTVGANIPCDAKADISTTPNAGIVTYCKTNPTTPSVPAAAAGRTTVYDWSCAKGQPVRGEQLVKVDARGFAVSNWKPLILKK